MKCSPHSGRERGCFFTKDQDKEEVGVSGFCPRNSVEEV